LKKKATIYITSLSLLVCLMWMFGLGWVLVDYAQGSKKELDTSNKPAEAAPSGGVQLLALGDSLTRGTGDEAGKGYIGYLKDKLSDKTDEDITLKNYGIKGQTSTELSAQVKQQEIQRQIKNADIIFITIGGNDLFQGGETLSHFDDGTVSKLSATYNQNLEDILTTIRATNEKTPIYLIGLYNPFSDLEDSELTSKIVRDWNYESAETSAAFARTIFVPTYDIFQQNVQTYLYSDHFHPNKQGYELMADRVASLISWEVEENE